MFYFATRWEKFTLELTVALQDEECQCTKSPMSTLSICSNLMVQQVLHVVDGQQVFTIHQNNDCVPNLRDKDLGLVVDLHIHHCE